MTINKVFINIPLKRRPIPTLLSTDMSPEKLLQIIDELFVMACSLFKVMKEGDINQYLDELFVKEKVQPGEIEKLQDVVYRAYNLMGCARRCAMTIPLDKKELSVFINIARRQLKQLANRLDELEENNEP